MLEADADSVDRDAIARCSPQLRSRQSLWPSGSEAGQVIRELA
jgi:hypothetical protein